MKNYDESIEINLNPNWPYLCDRPHRVPTIGGSGSECVTKLNKISMTRY